MNEQCQINVAILIGFIILMIGVLSLDNRVDVMQKRIDALEYCHQEHMLHFGGNWYLEDDGSWKFISNDDAREIYNEDN